MKTTRSTRTRIPKAKYHRLAHATDVTPNPNIKTAIVSMMAIAVDARRHGLDVIDLAAFPVPHCKAVPINPREKAA